MGPAGTVAVLLVLVGITTESITEEVQQVNENVFKQDGDDNEDLTAPWQEDRGEKALLGSFPFPGQRGPAQAPPGAYRQQLQRVATSNRIDLAAPKKFELLHSLAQNETVGDTSYVKDGRRCVDKVMMVEETQYDEVLTCDHSYDNRCHTSYVTKYEPHQEEDCEEKFKKICYIEYEKKAYTEKVQVCTTPFEKDCRDRKQRSLLGTYRPGRPANPRAGDQALDQEEEVQEDEQLCQTIYETECATTQTVHEVEDDVAQCKTVQEEKCEEVKEGFTTELKCDKWPREVCTLEKKKVKKYTPNTSCQKVPKQMCAPRGCGIKEGGVLCQDKLKTVVVDSPVEECDMEPIRTCKHVTKLVPRLVATQECVDVPKEICARSKINPRKVRRPAIQKWCYKLNSTDDTIKSPTPDPSDPGPECLSDADCTAGYTCVQEEGKCRARPGKVLVNSITVRTASCTDCTSEGVIVSLEGERIGGNNGEAPAPVPCTTGLLDRAITSDFGTGESSRWAGSPVDDEERAMLGGCYEAPLNAMVRGGSLEWRGEGAWVPDTVCVDWKSTNMAYQCRAVPKGVFFRQDSGQVGAREFALVECQDLFPHQSCEAADQGPGAGRRG